MKLPNAQFEFDIKTGEVTVSGLDEALLCVLPVISAMLFTHPPPISKFCIQP